MNVLILRVLNLYTYILVYHLQLPYNQYKSSSTLKPPFKFMATNTNKQQQIRLHHEKWRKWRNQMSFDMFKQKDKSVERYEVNVHKYANDIIGKLQQQQSRDKEITNEIAKAFESNSCSKCHELMIPPRNPMTLFPCGHNMCIKCLFETSEKKKLKTKTCHLCDSPINNYAENRSLMNIICTYTDNKHLIPKQEPYEKEQQPEVEVANKLKLRCEILEKQRKSILTMLTKERKDKKILDEVMDKLKQEKKVSDKQISALEQESKLVDRFLNEKKEELEKIKAKIASTEEKRRVVERTLEPLKLQKQKMQLLELAKVN